MNYFKILVLLMLQVSTLGYAQDKRVQFHLKDNFGAHDFNLAKISFAGFQKTIEIADLFYVDFPEKLTDMSGYVNIIDTVNGHIITVPVFLDDKLTSVEINTTKMIDLNDTLTLSMSNLTSLISYGPSVSNHLNLEVYLNSMHASQKHGITDGNVRYLSGKGENYMLHSNLSLLKKNPDESYSLFFLKNYFEGYKHYLIDDSLEEFIRTFDLLSDSLKESEVGRQLSAELSSFYAQYHVARVGNKVPFFEIPDKENEIISNKLLLGKPYVIAFSATWCLPCKEALPKLKQVYEKYKHIGLEVLYINLHDDKKAWFEMIDTYDMNWVNVSELVKMRNSEIAKMFNVMAIPTYILVDKSGNMVYNSDQNESYGYLEKYVQKLE